MADGDVLTVGSMLWLSWNIIHGLKCCLYYAWSGVLTFCALHAWRSVLYDLCSVRCTSVLCGLQIVSSLVCCGYAAIIQWVVMTSQSVIEQLFSRKWICSWVFKLSESLRQWVSQLHVELNVYNPVKVMLPPSSAAGYGFQGPGLPIEKTLMSDCNG